MRQFLPRLLLLQCFLFLFFCSCAPAQGKLAEFDGLRKRDQKTLREARQAFDFGEYARALPALDRLINEYPDVVGLRNLRAVARRSLGNPAGAAEDLRHSITAGGGRDYRIYRELGLALGESGDFAGARDALQTYRDRLPDNVTDKVRRDAEQRLASAELAVRLAADPLPFAPERLRGGVNTPEHPEYFPTISVDGRRLIFTRNLYGQNEDFYESHELADGSWSPAEPLAGVNTEFNEAAQTVTADGRLLVFTACNRPDSRGGCDLYYSERRDGRWTPAQNLGEPVNTPERETQPSLSADGRYLFFASRRPGGQGGHDLYLSARRSDGSWGQPRNLGPGVNTSGDEVFPFWAADGRTLFFTSTGHPGLGGADLFRTQLIDDAWTPVQNLGYPINTPGEETNLYITLDGRTAYYSRGERGALEDRGVDVDIYRFELPTPLRPTPATYLEATVTDAATGRPLPGATVHLRAVGETERRQTTDAAGYFLTVLPAGRDYALTVEEEGYLFYSHRFQLDEGYAPDDPYRLEIALQPLDEESVPTFTGAEADGAVALRNVLFETGSAELLPVSANELDRLVSLLRQRPALGVEIAGHTDNVGQPADNQQLSEARATAVRDYLVAAGTATGRITTVGYGEERPVATNATPAGRAANRRTTFRLLRP